MSGPARVLVLMGVSGSGKTTVGWLAARRLGWAFYDADDFHPEANVEKMRAGIPLGDAERAPWLARLHALIRERLAEGRSLVLACSALKADYRDRLRGDLGAAVRFAHLQGDGALIASRLSARENHYMKADLLASQLATLEPPADAIALDIALAPEELAAQAAAFALSSDPPP